MTGNVARIPATVITGFLGAGKTTLIRHIIKHADGRRIAIIVNEFGAVGIDGALLKSCGIPGCAEDSIVELANGCLCCTVADEFLPAMNALLARTPPPDHIVIETSGLALPKPLIKAFNWPDIRSRVTVDGVVVVVDGVAMQAGQFSQDPQALARQRAADPSVAHDDPLAEVFEDQLRAADLVIINKSDQLESAAIDSLRARIEGLVPRAVKIVATSEGRLEATVMLGMHAAAEDDLAARPSCHDALDGAHEHDDFESFSVDVPEIPSLDRMVARMQAAAEEHGILRMKGFLAVSGKPMRAVVQGVGTRFRQEFDQPWQDAAERRGQIVIIGQVGLDRAAIEQALLG